MVVLNRLQSSPFRTRLSPDQWTMPWDDSRTFLSIYCHMRVGRVRIWRGSGAYTHRHYLTTHDHLQRAAEAIRNLQRAGETKGPSDDQDDPEPTAFGRVDRLLFFNMFKNGSRSLFRYPTHGGLRRLYQISPRRYREVLESAGRFPTVFAKLRSVDQKTDRGLSGAK